MRNAFLILFVLVFSEAFAQMDTSGRVVDVTKWGAFPDDGKDDTKALRKAVDFCKKKPGSTLYIPAGKYQLRDPHAVDLERKAMAGEFGENPERTIFTPYYPYTKGLDLKGMKDVTILATGATLLCEGWMEPISMDSCKNVSLVGLTVDYKHKPFSMGEVTLVTENYFEVQFTDLRQITQQMPLTRMTFWEVSADRMYPEPIYFPKRELLGHNLVRFHHQIPAKLKGTIASVNHSFHFRPAILINRSQNIKLNSVTIHSQPGMGVVGFDSKDISLYRLSVVPAPGFYESTNTDATHFACCEGLLEFNQCTFKGQGDDATNVHGYYQTLVEASANRAKLLVKAGTYTHTQEADVPRVGDQMELVEVKTLKPVKTLTVLEAKHEGHQTFSEVVLSGDLPSNFSDYYLMNITKLPKLRFVNSTVYSHLARAVLVKTRDVLIDNNVFKNSTGTAIHVGAESAWHEGTHAKNVTITNNFITGCGNGAGSQGKAAGIAVIIEAADTHSSFLHSNIRIENNFIKGENNECGIYIGNARDVVLKNNRILDCKNDYITHSTTDIIISK